MIKTNKFTKFFAVLLTFTIAFGSLIQSINAVDLADPSDQFNIVTPSPNSNVKGVVPITFKAYDDDRSNIEYSVRLYDYNTCNDTFYGNINTSNTIPSNANNNTTINWDTKKTTSNSNIDDGNYCVKVCLLLYEGNSPYSACSARTVKIINSNKPPVIVSNPIKLQYKEGEAFSYQVQAQDPDGDFISYRLITSPGILTINPQTGLITSGALSSQGNGQLTYTVTVGADDGIYPTVNQTFTFTINKGSGSTTPSTPTTPSTGTPESNEEEPEVEEKTAKFSFKAPKQGDLFTDEVELVKWEFSGNDPLTEIKLEYSSDLERWFGIGEIDTTDNYFLWGISALLDNDYFLKLSGTTESGKTIEQVSQRFTIKTYLTDEEEVVSAPLISNFSPENDEEVEQEETKFAISGKFTPSTGATIVTDSFSITVDSEDFTEFCVVTEEEFICTPTEDFNNGKHTVAVEIKDTSEQKAESQWTFSVLGAEDEEVDPEVLPQDDSEVVSTETTGILGNINPVFLVVIICLAGMLLFIPWVIFGVLSKGKKTNKPRAHFDGGQHTNDLPPIPEFLNQPPADGSQPVKPPAPETKLAQQTSPFANNVPIEPYSKPQTYPNQYVQDFNGMGSNIVFGESGVVEEAVSQTPIQNEQPVEELPIQPEVETQTNEPQSEPTQPIEVQPMNSEQIAEPEVISQEPINVTEPTNFEVPPMTESAVEQAPLEEAPSALDQVNPSDQTQIPPVQTGNDGFVEPEKA